MSLSSARRNVATQLRGTGTRSFVSWTWSRAEEDAKRRLIDELQQHALVLGDVQLSSGAWAKYYVDAKRAILAPAGFSALGVLIASAAKRFDATAVGGLTLGADAVACSALAAKADVKAFFVRKERKPHGLQRWIEGPELIRGEACLVVDDVVTSGRSVIDAVDRMRDDGLAIAGVVAVVDRLAGGGEAIEATADAPYIALTTIDDIYPGRPDQ